MTRLGKTPEFSNGLRVTDAETLDIARMVLVGRVNRDIVSARGSTFFNPPVNFFRNDRVAKIKFPTADESEGLGTGKFDEGVGVEFSRTFLRDFIAYFAVSYTIIGSPAGTDLNNQAAFDIGLGYKFTPQLLGSVLYEERTALVTGEQNPRSLLFNADFKVSQAFRLNALVEAGLSSGAPNYGLTAGASVKF